MKYQYNEFVEYRDLSEVIERSIPVLEQHGINPDEFYTFLLEHPEVLEKEPEEIINEFLAGLGGAIKGAFTGWGAKGGVKQAQDQLAQLKKDPVASKASGFGDVNDPNNPYIQKLEKEIATNQANASRGLWQNIKQGYTGAEQQAQQQKTADQEKGRMAQLQQKFGIGPFAQQQSQQGQQPPQNQSQNNAVNPKQLAANLQTNVVNRLSGGSNKKWLRDALDDVINQLNRMP